MRRGQWNCHPEGAVSAYSPALRYGAQHPPQGSDEQHFCLTGPDNFDTSYCCGIWSLSVFVRSDYLNKHDVLEFRSGDAPHQCYAARCFAGDSWF